MSRRNVFGIRQKSDKCETTPGENLSHKKIVSANSSTHITYIIFSSLALRFWVSGTLTESDVKRLWRTMLQLLELTHLIIKQIHLSGQITWLDIFFIINLHLGLALRLPIPLSPRCCKVFLMNSGNGSGRRQLIRSRSFCAVA